MRRLTQIGRVLLGAALIVWGCVSDKGERPDSLPITIPDDPGSGPFNCNQDDPDKFELEIIDDFELGAASGTWFTNNEVCEECQELADERAELFDALARAEQGPSDAGVGALDSEGDTDAPLSVSELQDEIDDLTDEIAACRIRCEASQTPTIFDKPLPADIVPDSGRCGSRYSLHLTAPKLIDWGANIGNILSPPKDASEWDGVAFWARRSPHSRGTIRVEIADKFTDSQFKGDDEIDGPVCEANFTLDKIDNGCDRYGGYAIVGPNWQFFTLPFAEMRQSGWGKPAPYLDIEALRSITFLFAAGTWDIWIDDVAYYKRRTN